MYTTQTNVEAALGRSLTASEATYFTEVLGPSIDAYINEQTGTQFNTDTDTSVSCSGEGTNLLVIPTMHSVTSVANDDGDPIDAATYSVYPVQPPHLAIKSKTGEWEKGIGNYIVNGKLGYAAVPDEIARIATDLAVNTYSVRADGVKSERVGDWSVTYETSVKDLTSQDKAVFIRYNRLSRGI